MASSMLWFNLGMGIYTERGVTYSGMAMGLGFSLMDTLPFDWFAVEYGGFLGGGIEINNYAADIFSGEVRESIVLYPWISVGFPMSIHIPLGDRTSISLGAALFPPTVSMYGKVNIKRLTVLVERKYMRLYTIGFYMSN